MTAGFTPPASPPKRLSVSAIRDFHRCGHYFKLSRIDKVPEDRTTHHMWAGSLVHAAFMLAYGTPKMPPPGSWRTEWTVDNAGSIEDALELFEMLWEGQLIQTGQEELVGNSRAQDAFLALNSDKQLKPVAASNFAKGQLKALKADNVHERKAAWKGYFKQMLEDTLNEGLPYPVVALEYEVNYQLGGVDSLGFIDIVMQRPDGELVFADLKSGSKVPMDKELLFEDQMNSYYECEYEGRKPAEVLYVHMKSGSQITVPRNENFIQALHETAPLVMAQIQDGVFVKRLGPDCGSCNRRKSCMGI